MSIIKIANLPLFSFSYGGKNSSKFLEEKWKFSIEKGETLGSECMSWIDPETELVVRTHVKRFKDFSAVDWVLELENCSKKDTPIIEDLQALDICIPFPNEKRLKLHTANGSRCQIDDFLPLTIDIHPESQKVISPIGGRSSDGAFPFMNFQADGCGVVIAIGWTGQWMTKVERKQNFLRIFAGMEKVRLKLYPGEKIRTPRILIMTWEGDDPEKANNQIRQLFLKHYIPRIDGKVITPPIAQCLQAYYYLTGKAGIQLEMKALLKAAALGVDAYWIDACWYGRTDREWWEEVGSWIVNKEKFPSGLKPVSDFAHKNGMKFILWFEPERVRKGSVIHMEHPEYLLDCKNSHSNLLYNLGNCEARAYITDLISNLITENGVDIYRQDFNFEPLQYWRENDEPDRIGINEIRHVEGLYKFWDELRRRNPKLWIDNCASGGRRIDLETISRSLPLWPSDFQDVCGIPQGQNLHIGDQCINAGLARWIPFFGSGVWNFTPYGVRGSSTGGFTFGFHIDQKLYAPENMKPFVNFKEILQKGKTLLDDDFPENLVAEAIQEQKSIREFLTGDYHLLIPVTVFSHDWCAWQFHREDLKAGYAMFFRRFQSPFQTIEIGLKNIKSKAMYKVSISPDFKEAPLKTMEGKDLLKISISIFESPGSLLLRYSQID